MNEVSILIDKKKKDREKIVFPIHLSPLVDVPVSSTWNTSCRARTSEERHTRVGRAGRGGKPTDSEARNAGNDETPDLLLILKRVLGHRHEDEIARNVCYTRSGSGQLNEILRRKQVRSLLESECGLDAMSNHNVVRGYLKRY